MLTLSEFTRHFPVCQPMYAMQAALLVCIKLLIIQISSMPKPPHSTLPLSSLEGKTSINSQCYYFCSRTHMAETIYSKLPSDYNTINYTHGNHYSGILHPTFFFFFKRLTTSTLSQDEQKYSWVLFNLEKTVRRR